MKTTTITRSFGAFIATLIALLALTLIACESSTAGESPNETIAFIDQNLQGNFNGKAYNFVSGFAEESFFEEGSYDLDLYNIEPQDGADPWALMAYPFSGYLKVMATVPMQVGKTDLFLDFQAGESFTVTMYDPDDGNLNIIAHIGTVEILEIDLVNNLISGRIAISNGDDDAVNGNFTVPIAPADSF